MSSNTLKLLCVAALLFAASPTLAADSPADEIVYRTNLGRADDVKLLLSQGASPDEVNDEGVPLLALASQRRDPEGMNVVKELLNAGADINGKDDNGQTALFYAARRGNGEVVKLLLDKGIDYYSLDENGDIARNAAFKAGHNAIVEQLDNFVKAQTVKTNKQYEEFNKAVAENYKAAEEAAKRAAEPPPAPVVENVPAPLPVEEKPVAPALLVNDKVSRAKVNALAEELAFNNCAFQYWYFCTTAKQPVELSTEELSIATQDNKDAIISIRERLVKEFGHQESFGEGISDAAKRRIYEEMAALPTNRARAEKGIGRMDDMRTRCKVIAQQWDVTTIDTSSEQFTSPPGGLPVTDSPIGTIGDDARKRQQDMMQEQMMKAR